MVKKIAAVILILITGGAWAYLDYQNKQELFQAEQSRQAMIQARAEAKVRFEAQVRDDLTICKANAEKANSEFLVQHQRPVPRKPGEFTITQTVADEATKMLGDATAACQLTFDTRIQNGY